MADLSEHLGPAGESLVLLAGLFLLVSMHPPFRLWVRRHIMGGAKLVARLYQAADQRSDGLHRWTVAFRMIFRDRRGLLTIIAALIVFDYVISGYQSLVHLIVAGPYVGQTHWDQPRGIEYSYFYWVSINLLKLIGYALFGWIALQYARGNDFDAASRFRPHLIFIAMCFCIAGIQFAASNIAPALQYFSHLGYWFNDPEYYQHLAAMLLPILAGLAFYGAGAFIVTRRHSKRALHVIISGFLGFIIMTLAIKWLQWSSFSFYNGYGWLDFALRELTNFTDTTLSSIVFIAFTAVLAAPSENQAPPT